MADKAQGVEEFRDWLIKEINRLQHERDRIEMERQALITVSRVFSSKVGEREESK